VERVLIVDWDVHHGNGTQDAFYETDSVLFCSLHQWPLYPGTGSAAERGEERGAGYTINVPLPAGTDDRSYARVFDDIVLPAANAYRPQLVLISAGFDAHARDPLGSMRLTEEGFADLARRVVQVADAHAEGRVVAILEGGYDPQALGDSVAATLAALDENSASLGDDASTSASGRGRNGDAAP
jgi:acetoin utilization deacetylase AcuC-like enzyme